MRPFAVRLVPNGDGQKIIILIGEEKWLRSQLLADEWRLPLLLVERILRRHLRDELERQIRQPFDRNELDIRPEIVDRPGSIDEQRQSEGARVFGFVAAQGQCARVVDAQCDIMDPEVG
jgi:hypothetical protein